MRIDHARGRKPLRSRVNRNSRTSRILEERLQFGAEFLLAHDRWALFHRLFGVPREAQPARALPRYAFEHPQECGEIPRANAVIDPSVEHDIVRPAEVDPRRITDTKGDFDPFLLPCL